VALDQIKKSVKSLVESERAESVDLFLGRGRHNAIIRCYAGWRSLRVLYATDSTGDLRRSNQL
jgi:hypothetical protein